MALKYMKKLEKELDEAIRMNKVLLEIINRIDKRILAKHGIAINVAKPERIIN